MKLQLRKIRKEKGITQTFIAKELGFKHPSGYSNIESGLRRLDIIRAKQIAEILGVPMDDFFSEEVTRNE